MRAQNNWVAQTSQSPSASRRTVLNEGKPFIARNEDELRAGFPDHELIFSLGIGSIMNIPVMFEGKCLGTMNVSGDAAQYGGEDAPTGPHPRRLDRAVIGNDRRLS